MSAHWHRSLLACLITSLIVTPLGSCNNGFQDRDQGPETYFSPLSEEEEQVLERMRYFIDAAEKLDADTRIPEAVRAELRETVTETRDALAEFISKREQGGARESTLKGIGVAAVGILGNDATGVGVADDPLLIALGLVALATMVVTNAPASKDSLGKSWCHVGEKLGELGAFVWAAGEAVADTAADAIAPNKPANSNPAKPPGSSTVDVAPVPAPEPKGDPDDEEDVCKPKAWCPHKGGDTWHNHCADEILGNVYPTCDAMVNGKRFDALAGRTLFELKTDNWGTYKEELKGWTLQAHAKTARHEHRLAEACGFDFAFVVADPELYNALDKELDGEQINVRYEPRCSRKNKPANMR